MADKLEITTNQTDRGTVFTGGDDRQRVSVLVSDHPALEGVPEALSSWAGTVAAMVQRYQPVARSEALRDQCGSICNATHAAIERARSIRRDHAERQVRLRTPAPSIDMTHQTERRAMVRGLGRAEQMRVVQSADATMLAALAADPGNLANLAPEAWEMAQDRYMALNSVELAGAHGRFERKPSLDELTVTGPDMTAAEAAAAEALDAFRRDRDEMEQVEEALQRTIRLLALTLDEPADVTLARVLAE